MGALRRTKLVRFLAEPRPLLGDFRLARFQKWAKARRRRRKCFSVETLGRRAVLAANLLMSEIMYHPSAPTKVEIAAGFDEADGFEYWEIANVASARKDLSHVQLVQLDTDDGIQGVAFDFLQRI